MHQFGSPALRALWVHIPHSDAFSAVILHHNPAPVPPDCSRNAPDNLQLESFFNHVRRRRRRIHGRKSTRELNRLGHYLVRSTAESEADLLGHLRQVSLGAYQAHRRKLLMAESLQQFLYCLHRDTQGTMLKLIASYSEPANCSI